MRLLLDTHLLVWVLGASARLSSEAKAALDAPEARPCFSVVSLWEIAIKRSVRPRETMVEPTAARDILVSNGYEELPVLSRHVLAVEALPLLHRDPFDRLLLAQAVSEGMILLTTDAILARYPGPIRKV